LKDITEWLKKQIAKESASDLPERQAQVAKYKETLEMLEDRVKDGKGIESIPLSNEEAKKLEEIAKEGGITPEVIGLEDAQIIRMQYVIMKAAKVGLTAAGVAASISLVLGFYKKYAEEGKKITDFQLEDWKDVLGDMIFPTVTAGVTATTLSVVGSFCESAVPGVGALLMAVFGIASLIPDYCDGKLTTEEFVVEAEMVCIDAAIVLLGTIVGQAVIPLPGLGALIGAIASSIAWQIINRFWGDDLKKVLFALNERIEKLLVGIKNFMSDLFERICRAIKNMIDHIKLLLDEDFNYNIHYIYKKTVLIYKEGKLVEKRIVTREKEANYVNS
jgi:hypothetical protein